MLIVILATGVRQPWPAGTVTQQDGPEWDCTMARYLMVLRPASAMEPAGLIDSLEPLISRLEAEVDHRTPAHLSAMLGGGDQLRLQLFADVQAKSDGRVLELVLMSREPMGKGSPQTRRWFDRLALAAIETMPQLELVFRSDRDGPMPLGDTAAGTRGLPG
jgi:hypothetical protein